MSSPRNGADNEEHESGNLPLPLAFVDFHEENGLDPSIYAFVDTIPRYIRLKPGCECQIPEIEAELKCKLNEVIWLPRFFAIPPQIYGMDASSGAAVTVLGVMPGDHVLDLCAAPGTLFSFSPLRLLQCRPTSLPLSFSPARSDAATRAAATVRFQQPCDHRTLARGGNTGEQKAKLLLDGAALISLFSRNGADNEEHESGNLPLPSAFVDFLEENGLDPSIYAIVDTIPRYIRLKPGCECQIPEIEAELKCKLNEVIWLPRFFAIPPQVQIASSKAYQLGKIYGMDASSGAAVTALGVMPGDHVLDLCAAPGAKLCMLADLLAGSGSLTGVDVARHRLSACRTLLQKYALGDHCRLFVADGTSFSLLPVKPCIEGKSCLTDGKNDPDILSEWTNKRSWKDRKKARLRNTSDLLHIQGEPDLIFYGKHSGVVGLRRSELFHQIDDSKPSISGYDKVLVDAECTHDGSFKHIQKFEYWGWKTLERRVLDAKRTDSLKQLQVQLLTNGFKLLRAGGSLVYSTCSLTVAQNEDVVEQFLSRNSSAELQEVEAATDWPCKTGRVPKTLRFDPRTSQTSGLFIAKFTKIET